MQNRDTSLDVALETVLDQLERQQARYARLEEDLKREKERLGEIKALATMLSRDLPDDERTRVDRHLQKFEKPVRIDPDAGKPQYSKILDSIYRRRDKTIRAPDIVRELDSKGVGVDPKYVNNTLLRLAEKGALVKIRRGVYAVRGGGAVFVTGHDLPNVESFAPR